EAWAKRYWTDFGKALAGDNPPARPRWAKTDDSEFGIAMRYLELSKSARNRRRSLTALAIAATVLLFSAIGVFEYTRALAQAHDSERAAEKARIGEESERNLRVEADKLRGKAEDLQRQADMEAETANTLRDQADAALLVAENQRKLAESRQHDFVELAELNGRMLAAASNHSSGTKDIIDSYQLMRNYYGRKRFRNPDFQNALDDLTVDAILKDNDWSASSAFPFFSQMYMSPSENDAKTRARVNIRFAQRIIDSEQREDAEAIEFLQVGIKGLDDAKDADEKADAYLQLAHAAGNSDEAIEAFSSAALLFQQTGKTAEEAAVLEKLGDTYKTRDEPAQARGQYEKALKLFGKLGDQNGIARMLNQIQLISASQP